MSAFLSAASREELVRIIRQINPAQAPAYGAPLQDWLRLAGCAPGLGCLRVLVGILDTGYDPDHSTLPAHLRLDLARNFTDDGATDDAVDPASTAPFTNPGHVSSSCEPGG